MEKTRRMNYESKIQIDNLRIRTQSCMTSHQGMCFCPQCGTLAFPDQANNINCTNYKCGYKGQLTTVIKMDDGKVISGSEIMTKLSSSPTAEKVPCIGQGCSTLVSRSTGRCGHCAQFSGGMMPGSSYRSYPW